MHTREPLLGQWFGRFTYKPSRGHFKTQFWDLVRPDVALFRDLRVIFLPSPSPTQKMALRRWDCVGRILLTIVALTSCPTTIADTLTGYGRIDENTTSPETTSLQGKIQGVNMLTRKNRTIHGFMGIPFAEPPVGDLRFKAPVAAGTWNGTFNASTDPIECPQLSGASANATVIGDEDCLYLQVYTPKLPTNDNSTLLPVMVFILGGAFKGGSVTYKSFGPTFLLDEDVVLVVPAFRLGVLGYLSTGDEASPGNYGLKDIKLALEWVRDNIRYFGGDPERVTFAGGSSGAISVSLLALADSTNGLFHKCITGSGTATALDHRTPVEAHVNHTMILAEYFGCPTNSTTIMVDCLRNVNATQLIDTNDLFNVFSIFPVIVWSPTTEPDVEGALLTDNFVDLVAAGNVRDVPWINLNVRDEGLGVVMSFYQDADLFEEFLDKIDYVLPYLLGYWTFDSNDISALTVALKAYYVNDLTADRSLLLKNVTDMAADAIYFWPMYYWIQQQLVRAQSPIYYTNFEYRGVFSHAYGNTGGNTSYTDEVPHGDEIIYLFEDIKRRFGPAHYEYSDTDFVMVDTMVQLWTSFVTNGTPTIKDSNISTTVWEPYSSLNNYLRIGNGSDTSLEMQYDLHIERMRFWEELTSSWDTATSEAASEAASTSGQSRKELQLLTVLICVIFLFALQPRRHGQ